MSNGLSVVLVHRSERERAGLKAAFEALPNVQVAGERSDLRAGIALAHQVRPAILVLELAAPVDDTLAAAGQYKLDHPDVAIFLCTDVFDPDTLLRAMRAGATEVLRRPLDRGALSTAVERVSALTARKQGGGARRHVFTVFSNKGGQGVSTIATNLALSLRGAGREVALVDFDYQSGDVAFLLGLSPRRSLGDVIAAPHIDSASVQDALTKHESGLFVLAQPEQLDRVDGLTGPQVGTVLEILGSTFEIVVIDAPHVFNEISLEVFDRSSSVLLVAEPSVPSVRAARRSLDLFQKLNYLALPDRVRLLMNRRSDSSAITAVQLEETLGVPVFATVSNDYAAVSQAINMGRPLCGGSIPEGRAGRDLAALARQLVPVESSNGAAAEAAAPAKRPGRMRLFGRG
ncbi:MAG: P-loop NTPase [Candidatus Eisenbacteria bacterium]|nr:P-loop NTPase [Candidatus Eisenbacteria bacterium]